MSSFGRKRKTTAKKLYAVKRSKTGRKSIVQVVSKPGKGKVYASTGRKLGKGTKSFTTKTAARSHLQSLQKKSKSKSSSFGKRKRRYTNKAKKGEGFIACVNPNLDEDRPSSYYKVFKAYTYKQDGETIRIFHTPGDDASGIKQYWQIREDSKVKFRKTREAANKDRIKYGRLANAGIDQGLLPEPCDEGGHFDLPGTLGGTGGTGGSTISGRRMRIPGLMGQMLSEKFDGNKRGVISLDSKYTGEQARLGTKGGYNRLLEVFGANPAVLGASPELMRSLRKTKDFRGKSNNAIMQLMNPHYAAHPTNTFEQIKKNRANSKLTGYRTLGSLPGLSERLTKGPTDSVRKAWSERYKEDDSSFGRSYFGSIPSYGRYAYPVDPALKRMRSGFGSGFGSSYYGYQPVRRPAFGRINYGFSRYF